MQTIQKMFDHLRWANRRILETLRDSVDTHEKAKKLFGHVLHAEQIWLARLQGQDSSALALWTDSGLEEYAELASHNDTAYRQYLDGLSDHELDRPLAYRNQSGSQSFETSIRDILTHVALHGQYHRGQINSMLRMDGFEPVNVDFITFVR